MKLRQFQSKCTALLAVSSIVISTGSISALAANTAPKTTMRTAVNGGEETYVSSEDLKKGDVIVKGEVFIDNYTGIANMKVSVHSDSDVKIEKGGFTVPELFEGFDAASTTDESEYYRNVDIANVTDVCMFYNKSFPYKNAVLAKDGTSFLTFDVRVPKGTAPGCYTVRVCNGWILESVDSNLRNYYTYAYSEDSEIELEFMDSTIIVEPEVMLGDVDCNGIVESDDATAVLRYYVQGLMNLPETTRMLNFHQTYIHAAKAGANVDGNDEIDAQDAVKILRYYVRSLTGRKNISWDEV